jgi:hypothetical protein
MQHAEVLVAVRQLIRSTFSELGAVAPVEMRENILIRDEMYCGRRFRSGDYQAIWFIEEDEIKIYAQGGAVLRVMSASGALSESPSSPKQAA